MTTSNGVDQTNKEILEARIKRFVSSAVIGVIVVIIIFGSFGTVGAGERGVFLQFGAVKDKVFGEGL